MIESGEMYDHFNVEAVVEELNDLVSCSGTQYHVTSAACVKYEISDCKSILNNTFSPPSCTDDATQSQKLFNQLKDYIETTIINAANLKG